MPPGRRGIDGAAVTENGDRLAQDLMSAEQTILVGKRRRPSHVCGALWGAPPDRQTLNGMRRASPPLYWRRP
jgi:hypothetical protein